MLERERKTKHIRCLWWAALFPGAVRSASVTSEGIDVGLRNELRSIDWSSVEPMPAKARHLFIQSVTLRAPGGDVRLYFANAKQRDEAWTQIVRGWYSPRLAAIKSRMSAFTGSLPRHGYVRTSQWTPIAQEFAALQATMPPIPPKHVLEDDQYSFLHATIEFVRSPTTWLKASRDRYVQNALLQHEHLFDTVESKPLSPRQREACVVDEDNNLILAGAGSGKTSAVIGRVAFLVQSGQARPDEILLLAYGNAAAVEMRERLEKRLGIKGAPVAHYRVLSEACRVA